MVRRLCNLRSDLFSYRSPYLALYMAPPSWVGCILLSFWCLFSSWCMKGYIFMCNSLPSFEGSTFVFIQFYYLSYFLYYRSFLYFPDTSLWLCVCVTSTFFYSMTCLSILFMVAFEQKFLILLWSNWPVFSFIVNLSLLWEYKDILTVFLLCNILYLGLQSIWSLVFFLFYDGMK